MREAGHVLSAGQAAGAVPARSGMVAIPGGVFRMGSDRHYPEEAPEHEARVAPFRLDRTPVTNREFGRFVVATGYVTVAEIAPRPEDFPGAPAHTLQPGALVFRRPAGPVRLDDWSRWWSFVFGASWREPHGPGSSIEGREDHPVVQIAHADAEAYADWAGKDLPTEAEWEFAARGGLAGAEFAWGEDLAPGGHRMANIWEGDFPRRNLSPHAGTGTSPVGAFPPNGYGLVDMIGNVWEWTSDWYAARHDPGASRCCGAGASEEARRRASLDPAEPGIAIPRRVIKGGSHLCAPSYCRRYRPAARHPQAVDSGTTHLGFRCVVRDACRA